jgi:protein CpxP
MQLTGRDKLVGGLVLMGAMALSSVVAVAQQPTTQGQGGQARAERQWRGGRRGFAGRQGGLAGRFAEKLNLTDAQKEQMRQIAARYRESAKALRLQRRAQQQNGQDFLKNGTFDEAAVRAAAQARANARVEMEVLRARMRFEMYNVLTPEQKAQLAAMRQQWQQKREEWRARRNQSPTE